MRRPATQAQALREARQRLQAPEQRLVDELLWFWPLREGGEKEDAALALVRAADVEGAVNAWRLVDEESPEAPFAQHNLALGWLLLALEKSASRPATDAAPASKTPPLPGSPPPLPGVTGSARRDWQASAENWRRVLDSDAVWARLEKRVERLADPRLGSEFARRLRASLPGALAGLHARVGLDLIESGGHAEDARFQSQLVQSYGLDETAIATVLENAVGPLAERMEAAMRAASAQAETTPAAGVETAGRLLAECRPVLEVCDAFLPAGSLLRIRLHDRLVNSAMGCVTDEVNSNQQWERALEVLPPLEALAGSEAVKARVLANIETIRGFRQNQLNFGTCWFCQKEKPDEKSPRIVPMYGNVRREGRTTHYQTRKVPVPRCAGCAGIHSRLSWQSWLAFVVSGVLGAMILANLWPHNAAIAIISGTMAFACGGCALFNFMKLRIRPMAIKRLWDYQGHPLILQARKEGWALGAKPPNVR